MTLDKKRPGRKYRIKKVNGEGPVFNRLMEMGFCESTELEVIRFAPLGDPMQVKLHGFNLSLRKTEAALVEVDYV
jgi:ferrous iron transport protein A